MNDAFSINREIRIDWIAESEPGVSGACDGVPFRMNRNHVFEYPHFLKANKFQLLLASIQTHHRHYCALEAGYLPENPSFKAIFSFKRDIQITHDQYHIYFSEDSSRFEPAAFPQPDGVIVGNVDRYVLKGLKPGVDYFIAVAPVDTALGPYANEGWVLNGTTGVTIQKTRTSMKLMSTGQDGSLPAAFALRHNYPNPFNPATKIRYELPKDQRVTVRVFDARGRLVQTLVDGKQSAGYYTVELDASSLASGLYFCMLQTEEFKAVQKMMLVR